MTFRKHFILQETKNFYYTVPKDKELLLYDFYSLEVLEHYAKKRFNPNDLEQSLAGYDEDDSEMISLKEARKTLIPYLKEEILDAMAVSIACEMRHAGTHYMDGIDEDLKPVFREYYKENHLNNTLPKSIHDASRHRAKKNTPSDNHSEKNRKNSVKAFNKTMKKFGRETTMKMAEQIFRKGSWSPSYGGPRWADIVLCWINLFNSHTLEKMSTYIDHAYDLQHNTGSVFNKVKEYYKDIHGFGWLAKALDKKYEALPWELVDNASSIIKKMGRRILQKARFPRNNNPDGLKKGDLIVYTKSKSDDGLIDGETYRVGEINELYGTADLMSPVKDSSRAKNVLLSKMKKKDEPKKSENAEDGKTIPADYKPKVGDRLKFIGPHTDDFLKQGETYQIADVKGTIIRLTKGQDSKTVQVHFFPRDWELVEPDQANASAEPLTAEYVPKVGDILKRILYGGANFTGDKNYEVLKVQEHPDVIYITLKTDLGVRKAFVYTPANWEVVKSVKSVKSDEGTDENYIPKVGDYLERLKDIGTAFTKGNYYKIEKVSPHADGFHYDLWFKNDEGISTSIVHKPDYRSEFWKVVPKSSSMKANVPKVGDFLQRLKDKVLPTTEKSFTVGNNYEIFRVTEKDATFWSVTLKTDKGVVMKTLFPKTYQSPYWKLIPKSEIDKDDQTLELKVGDYVEYLGFQSDYVKKNAVYKVLNVKLYYSGGSKFTKFEIQTELPGVQEWFVFSPMVWMKTRKSDDFGTIKPEYTPKQGDKMKYIGPPMQPLVKGRVYDVVNFGYKLMTIKDDKLPIPLDVFYLSKEWEHVREQTSRSIVPRVGEFYKRIKASSGFNRGEIHEILKVNTEDGGKYPVVTTKESGTSERFSFGFDSSEWKKLSYKQEKFSFNPNTKIRKGFTLKYVGPVNNHFIKKNNEYEVLGITSDQKQLKIKTENGDLLWLNYIPNDWEITDDGKI